MKKIFFLLACMTAITVNAQTADEVVAKYSKAMGGLEAFNKIKTAKITATMAIQGLDIPITTFMVNNKAMRTEIDAQGQKAISVYNNGTGWKTNPFAGVTSPTVAEGSELVDLKAQASLANNLMDYKNRGHKIELLGQEDVEGIKCYKIKLTAKEEGKESTYFVNSGDFLLVKVVSKRDFGGQEAEVETFYSDMKEINGLKFAMSKISKIEGEIFQETKYNTIELDIAIDEAIFKME